MTTKSQKKSIEEAKVIESLELLLWEGDHIRSEVLELLSAAIPRRYRNEFVHETVLQIHELEISLSRREIAAQILFDTFGEQFVNDDVYLALVNESRQKEIVEAEILDTANIEGLKAAQSSSRSGISEGNYSKSTNTNIGRTISGACNAAKATSSCVAFTEALPIEDRIRNRIAEIVGPQKYKSWFKNSTQFSHGDGYLKVGVPNLFIGSFIEDHFADVIQQVAAEVFESPLQISYAIDPFLFRKLRKGNLNSQVDFSEQGTERSLKDMRDPDSKRMINTRSQFIARTLRGRLDQFVVGSNNSMAHSMAISIVENPHGDATPLFIYSGCGLGKTHLLQGIANGLSERQPNIRWLYVSGEEFTNQFILALRERRLDAFRHRFRDIDVLLLDDMQFIANKKATQEEFLHTFIAINANAKRVVLASDAHPKMMSDLSESLANRIVAGMVVKIERPDKATRCEILRRRAALTQHAVPAPVIDYIAEKINANVRELEGCLVKLIAYASLTKSPVTLDLARQALEDHLTQTGKLLTISDIEQNVATFFGLSPADLHTSRKSRTIALARNIAMHLARKHTTYSFPEIARFMGNKNHTTVLLACRRINASLVADAEVSWQSAAGVQSRKLRELVEAHEQRLYHHTA